MNWGGDWRLPATVDEASSYGFNPPSDSSEMAHLYYVELGNASMNGLINTGDFQHLVAGWTWSSTEYTSEPDFFWFFDSRYGIQLANHWPRNYYGLAVRPGLIESAAVPEPSTLLMVGMGLAGVVFWRKRKS